VKRRLPGHAAAALALLAVAGCGVARLETARTIPRGQTRTTVAASLVHTSDRGFTFEGVPIVPLDVMIRHGATDQVDWGVRLFFGLGLLADVKWNLLPARSRSALALTAGVGGAVVPNTGAQSWARMGSVPVTLTASHAVRPWLTPYAAVGYGAYWIFDYGARDPTVTYAPRSWTGDGLVTLSAGVELARASGGALLVGYSYARPVVDDPGDLYKFAVSHVMSIGYRTGGGPTFSR